MNPPPLPHPVRSGWRTVPRWLKCTLFSLLIAVAAGIIWFVAYRVGNTSAIRRLETRAKSRGEPLTLAEVAATYPPISTASNAADALIEIWKQDDPVFWGAFLAGIRPLPQSATTVVDPRLPILGAKAQHISRNEPLSEPVLAAAQEYLKARSSHIDAVRAALRRPSFRAPINIPEGFAALLPHVPMMRKEAQNFRLVALVAADQGDVDAAVTALSDAARIGQLLSDEPLLVSQLVRIACLGARRRQIFVEAAAAAKGFPPKLFSGMLLPGQEKMAIKFGAFEARRRAAGLAIITAQYRLAHHDQAPEQLDALRPNFLQSIPLDPFDGLPLRYRKNAYGFVIYSVGADGRDNGGLERPSKGPVKEFDETFFVGR